MVKHQTQRTQALAQEEPKLLHLMKTAADPTVVRQDLMNRLDGIGLLQEEAKDPNLTDEQLIRVIANNPELETWLQIEIKKVEEIPGAQELLDSLTIEDWMEAIDNRVMGRS